MSRRSSVLVRVPAPGLYAMRLTITAPSHRRHRVDLWIGGARRRVEAGGRFDRSGLKLQVKFRTRVLRVLVAARHTKIHITVSARRVRPHRARGGAPVPLQHAGATGATGVAEAATSPVASAAATGPAPATVAVATPPPAPPVGSPGPPGDPATWHLTFDDEFNGTSLDTSNWSTGWFGSGITAPVSPGELECYDPAQVNVAGGELDLNLIAKSESCGGQTRPYASGLVSTSGKFNFTYGYIEARAWLPGAGSVADWPAIWTDGQSWPADGEMDLVEGLQGHACWHFHDPLGAPGGCAPSPDTGGWHTFGADWEPGIVTYYYDGLPVGTVTTGITDAPMYIILNLAADNVNGGPLQAPASLRIDYVRVWEH